MSLSPAWKCLAKRLMRAYEEQRELRIDLVVQNCILRNEITRLKGRIAWLEDANPDAA